jgi:hypothetical protein
MTREDWRQLGFWICVAGVFVVGIVVAHLFGALIIGTVLQLIN